VTLLFPAPWTAIIALLILALGGAIAGMRLAETPRLSRRILPFSGGVLLGVALFWIAPEIAQRYGWTGAVVGALAGFGALAVMDRYLYPVCPSCAHTHSHEDCRLRLHGFATPLIVAAGIHNFFDGWGLMVAQQQDSESLKMALLIGIGLHKLPEGLALGVLLLAALGSRWKAALGSFAAQAMMIVGALVALLLWSEAGPRWTGTLLAIAAGVFVFLGYHAIDAESRERGASAAFLPALTGAVAAAALRLAPGL